MPLKHRIEYYLFIILGGILCSVGFSRIKYSAKCLSFIAFYVLQIRKKLVLKNLSEAFPQLSKKDVKKLAFKNYTSFAITFLEVFAFSKLSKEDAAELMNVPDINKIRELRKKNKGLLLLTAHFGNWELGAVSLSVQLNAVMNVLAKHQSNEKVNDFIDKRRKIFGNKVIPLGATVREIYKALYKNEIVGVVGDQRGPSDGVRVNFFNRSTATYPGTAAIAVKTKAPVLMVFTVRNKNNTYDLITRHLDVEILNGTLEDQILEFNQIYMNILEEFVRKYPEQWFWMHNIWKY